MRVMIPMLEKQSAKTLITALQTDLDTLLKQENDESSAKLYATLGQAQKALSDELRPLLILLGLHERFIQLNLFEDMAKQVNQNWTTDKIRRFADSLSLTGLLHDRVQNNYELHPALTGYLRAYILKAEPEQTREPWTRAFVDVMGRLADSLTKKQLHEKRFSFHVFGASFYFAMNEAQRIGMDLHFRAILRSLAFYAYNANNYKEAETLFLWYAESHKVAGDIESEAAAYHQLGIIVEERLDFDAAEKWYQKSLEIEEKHGNEHGMANTYHQLGNITSKRRDFEAAEKWCRKSLEINEKHGDEHGVAKSYHQLGDIALERLNFDAAENWYHKSLEIKEKHGDEHGAAITYHNLGYVAFERRDFDDSEKWYMKSLKISEKHGSDFNTAATYNELGKIASDRRDFDAAENWYHKSLEIKEKHGDERGAAITYHNLGHIAQKRRDFGAAEKWYLKSLEIKEKHGNEYGAALTFGNLGILAELQEHFEESGKVLIKAIISFLKCNAPSDVQEAVQNFMIAYKKAAPETQAKLKAMWESAGLGELPDESFVVKGLRKIFKWFGL